MPGMNDSVPQLLRSMQSDIPALTVSQLTARIKGLLERDLRDLRVQGEISNLKRHNNGHLYFTLKDRQSQIRCVFFNQWNRLLRYKPEDGLEVRVRGRVEVYAPYGSYQLLVETMEPLKVGDLQLAYEQQVKRLRAEGLFDPAHKRKLPLFPRRIGVITSAVGAAVRDILRILERRHSGLDVLIAPARVQGDGAHRDLVAAIALLNHCASRDDGRVDVIILARGGGSAEDLHAFNHEQLARAIYSSAIPIVSAVGHESDMTIADLVADARAATPSAAAAMVSPDLEELKERVASAGSRLERGMRRGLSERAASLARLRGRRGFTGLAATVQVLLARRRELEERACNALEACLRRSRIHLDNLQRRFATLDPAREVEAARIELSMLVSRLGHAHQMVVDQRSTRLAIAAGRLDAMSPLKVLARGYAIVKTETDELVKRASEVALDQRLKLRFNDGEVGCRVTATKE
jgi:exodeoxyribonuclease VII large subunit